MHVKGQAIAMHEPRFKRALGLGYAVSPTGADHCHSLHDVGVSNPDVDGFADNRILRGMGVLEPVPLESLGPDKVRAAKYHTVEQVMINCLPLCLFVPWTMGEIRQLVQAATGFDVSDYELIQVGARAYTLARVFNVREGFSAADDHLPDRSHGPTTSGALAEAGIDRDELQRAIRIHYGMMGWDRDTGVPLSDTLSELDVPWAAEHLPG
jgi:aldehyde:ferredoxin oxidoreductase